MVEYILKKDYKTSYGTLKQGGSIRIMIYNGSEIPFYDGGMVNFGYRDIILNLVKNPDLRDEYLSVKEVLKDKV